MTASRIAAPGWLDRPVHPALGLTMFLAGAGLLMLALLYTAARLFLL
jgi:hypothetical protein